MFILEIAALVAAFIAIPENTVAPASRSAGVPFAVEEEPFRRALKHEVQYTGLSGSGWKGTVVDILHSAQTAEWRRVRLDGRGRVNRDSKGTRRLLRHWTFLKTPLTVACRQLQWGCFLINVFWSAISQAVDCSRASLAKPIIYQGIATMAAGRLGADVGYRHYPGETQAISRITTDSNGWHPSKKVGRPRHGSPDFRHAGCFWLVAKNAELRTTSAGPGLVYGQCPAGELFAV